MPSELEIAVAAPTSLPQMPGPLQPASGASGFSLSVNVRLVDVDVTAFDKKGHPVTSLTMKDFDLYDNGRKQTLRSLTRVNGAASQMAQGPATAEQGTVYSNRPEAFGNSGMLPAQAQLMQVPRFFSSTRVEVSFADLNYSREQILKFLNRLPESEPVGLYARRGPSFQILAEQTTDHAALSSLLRKWVPNAQELARAQEEESRNLQHFDFVDSPGLIISGTSAEAWSGDFHPRPIH